MSWADDAACKGMDTALFFPAKGEDLSSARSVCARCTVTAECLEEALALATNDDLGIRGGLSQRQRRQIRRLAPISHGTIGGAQTHRRRGEKPCGDCLWAEAVYKRETRPSRAKASPSL